MTAENSKADTILFVDDEEIVIKPMCILPERSGYHVFSVNSGKQAIEVIKHKGTQVGGNQERFHDLIVH